MTCYYSNLKKNLPGLQFTRADQMRLYSRPLVRIAGQYLQKHEIPRGLVKNLVGLPTWTQTAKLRIKVERDTRIHIYEMSRGFG